MSDSPRDDLHAISDTRELHDGVSDGLVPSSRWTCGGVETLDDLVREMGSTAFAGRALGEAADVLEAMIRDPGLPRGLHAVRRDDDRQDGARPLRHDRSRVDPGDRLDRRAHGARLRRGDGTHALQARPARCPTPSSSRRATTASTTRWSSSRAWTTSSPSCARPSSTLRPGERFAQLRPARPSRRLARASTSRAAGSSRRPTGRGSRCTCRPSPTRSSAWTSRCTCGGAGARGVEPPRLRRLPGPRGLRRARSIGAPRAGDLHGGGRRPAQLGPAGGPVSRHREVPAAARTCPSGGSATGCGSAPSPSTGAGSRAARTPRGSPGASSCRRPGAGATPRSWPTPRSPGPSSPPASCSACRTAQRRRRTSGLPRLSPGANRTFMRFSNMYGAGPRRLRS